MRAGGLLVSFPLALDPGRNPVVKPRFLFSGGDDTVARNPKLTFAEFWPYYLAEHRRPGTRALHLLATLSWLGLVAAAVVTRSWWWLAAIPVVAYGLAWVSHFFIERNRPATFKHPLYSLLADHKMVFCLLTGRLVRELDRLPPAHP